ncbi:MAG: N,N-dimethylformamidase large subunit [Gammaproteobacteria bacterium]|nr:N,N-dimethylformamidase large subunit [Gammaproteobacteria bacterium]
MLPITGYSDRLSAAPGERLAFKVSSPNSTEYTARLVRIIHADPNPQGPGIKEVDLASVFSARLPAREQPVHLGSYARIPTGSDLPVPASFTFVAHIWPTTPTRGLQSLFCWRDPETGAGVQLEIDPRRGLSATLHDTGTGHRSCATDSTLRQRVWYRVWMSYDAPTGILSVGQAPLQPLSDEAAWQTGSLHTTSDALPASLGGRDILLAAGQQAGEAPDAHYNGKLERPLLCASVLDAEAVAAALGQTLPGSLLAAWDFSIGISTARIHDVGPHQLHGRLVNLPARAMTGPNWDGSEMCWRHQPAHYGAIHFHDDDLHDCGWDTDFEFEVPDDLRSGLYAIRIANDRGEDALPFVVTPPRGQHHAAICVLLPTFTYNVYANHARRNTDERYKARVEAWQARPWTPDEHPEYGLSTYNFHSDGSGIAYASRLRPMITMRPGYVTFAEPETGSGLRHLPADTHLLDWLEHKGFEYDLITDEDLHADGAALLDGYKVLLTTSHPEYHTHRTWQAIHDYTRAGGRLMYLGGNGFYWRVAVNPELPGAVEIRRAEGGIRAWAAEPGEYYHAFDGQYGGLWRRNGRPPQALAGVGFSAQGRFQGSWYRRAEASYQPEFDWAFEGIEDELLGDFGLSGGGAAGFELDRAEARLGTPPNATILASSEAHQAHFVLVPEELLTHVTTWAGKPIAKLIRADIVYFPTHHGGAVFSVGSITWCGSLSHAGYVNNISRLTENVLRRFSA